MQVGPLQHCKIVDTLMSKVVLETLTVREELNKEELQESMQSLRPNELYVSGLFVRRSPSDVFVHVQASRGVFSSD